MKTPKANWDLQVCRLLQSCSTELEVNLLGPPLRREKDHLFFGLTFGESSRWVISWRGFVPCLWCPGCSPSQSPACCPWTAVLIAAASPAQVRQSGWPGSPAALWPCAQTPPDAEDTNVKKSHSHLYRCVQTTPRTLCASWHLERRNLMERWSSPSVFCLGGAWATASLRRTMLSLLSTMASLSLIRRSCCFLSWVARSCTHVMHRHKTKLHKSEFRKGLLHSPAVTWLSMKPSSIQPIPAVSAANSLTHPWKQTEPSEFLTNAF